MPKLLVVDDDRNIRLSLVRTLQPLDYEVHSAESGPQALQLIESVREFDIVLSDWRMAEMNGLELLRKVKEASEKTIVILMTAYGTIENAVAAMKEGAHDYLTKPFSVEQIRRTIERAVQVRQREPQRWSQDSATAPAALATRSPYYQALVETAYAAASSDATILLTGETGTGKNVLARQIHEWTRGANDLSRSSIALLSAIPSWRANCSVMLRALSPAPTETSPDGWKRRMAGRYFSTR